MEFILEKYANTDNNILIDNDSNEIINGDVRILYPNVPDFHLYAMERWPCDDDDSIEVEHIPTRYELDNAN